MKIELICVHCNKNFIRSIGESNKAKGKGQFCSKKCAAIRNNINRGIKNKEKPRFDYRDKATRFLEHKCSNPHCELSAAGIYIRLTMLDVDHIDENRKNNALANLQFLCVWCHAIKTRFR